MQIKVTEEVPVKIRDAFVASPGYLWISADYSQLEYRTMANLAMDTDLIRMFGEGVDFHTATASMMLKIPVDQVDKKARKIGKTLNFAISFGMTANGLANALGCSKEEAKQKQADYFKNIPKIKELIDITKATTKARGYSRTFFGRMRPFKKQLENAAGNWYKEDNALMTSFNTTVQGTGADCAKIALGRVYQALLPYGERVRILTQVHDEINYEVQCVNPDGTIDTEFLSEVVKVIDYAMSFRGVYPGWADVPADIEIGWNYGQLKDPKEFGIDLDTLLKDQPPTDVPKWLFENLDYDNLGSVKIPKNASPSGAQKSRGKAKTASDDKPVVTPTPENSVGLKMAKTIEQKMRTGNRIEGRLDLANAQFKTSTLVICLKSGVDDNEAFETLKRHISENFGANDLVLEDHGVLYQFPMDYRVNDSYADLEEFFDVDLFKVQPKVKLEL